MKTPLPLPSSGPCRSRRAEHGSARSLLLPLVCFGLGLAVGASWLARTSHGVPSTSATAEPELSGSTRALLGQLTDPVEIHFYSLLDSSAPASLGAYSQRAERLLAAYQQQAAGKIVVTGLGAQTNRDPEVPLADGIKGFDLDKGQGSYLGMALLCNGRKEVLPQLSPDWEPALEADISRAIQRLREAAASAQRPAQPISVPADVIGEVRRRIPNLDSVSLQEATRMIRADSVKDFTAAAAELQTRVQEAQRRLAEAQRSGAPSGQDAAMKNLQSVQAEQARRLKEIAADSQARIEALKQLKSAAH